MQLAMIGAPSCTVLETTKSHPYREPTEDMAHLWSATFPAYQENDQLWNVARDCLENIGTLRSQRRPLSHEDWQAPRNAEQRLLEQIDAVVACGEDIILRAVESVRESEIPDPALTFAVILVLGCVSGTKVLDAATELFALVSARDPEEAEAAAEAFSLAPNPKIPSRISDLLTDASLIVRSSAARVLSWRGDLTVEQIERLTESTEVELKISAIEAMTDGSVKPSFEKLAEWLDNDSEAVVRAATRLSMVNRASSGRHRAVELITSGRPDFADSILWLGMAGEHRDRAVFEQLLKEPSGTSAIMASGYWGYREAIPLLLSLMDQIPDERPTVAFAMERITGASLTGWDSDSQELRMASTDEYMRWWLEHDSKFRLGLRYRRGLLFSGEVLLQELSTGTYTSRERTITHLELTSCHQGRPPRFRADDFIYHQQQSILDWKERLGSSTKV